MQLLALALDRLPLLAVGAIVETGRIGNPAKRVTAESSAAVAIEAVLDHPSAVVATVLVPPITCILAIP
jgi:hypothetical protein